MTEAAPKMTVAPAAKNGPARQSGQGPDRPKPAGTAGSSVDRPGLALSAPSVARTVAQTRIRLRHVIVMLSFLVCVLIPTALTGLYLWGVAADQYASKVGFSVRREEGGSAMDLLGGIGALTGTSSSTDTDILYEFIQSQRMVADIDGRIDLRSMWSRPENDVIFAYDETGTIEDLLEYWNNMVRLSYDSGAGLIEVEVRAFVAEDATRIAEEIFDESSEMINKLSSIAQQDAIGYARDELETALERLKQARETVTRFRNLNQLVDPTLDLQSQAGLLGSLEAQLAEQLIEVDILRDTGSGPDPRLTQAQRRVEVIQNRIDAERAKLGVSGQGADSFAFADLVGEYERLVVDREFAETAYVSALASFDAAQAEARRKSRYLAAYMEPTRAEASIYPQRLTLLALVSLFLFLGWSIVTMVAYSLKDRR
ncbi:capsule biosynthesis protein [Jannaschia faecimaris]|uniref:capsule biosynthesis protein n=1 Tax=Jannaschia faecimaris TaxID=1244108 RepID=UPI001FCDBD68|nr:capsule biosynthesis protein [Jannaschia faecimaris]